MKLLELFEAETKHITFVFGRLNPPTIGHKQLLDTAAKVGGDYKVFVSPSQDKKDNPLDYSTKIKFIKSIIPEHAGAIVEDPSLNTPVKIASYLYDQGYRAATFIAGSDRLESMKKLLEMYNGVEGKAHGYYKFDVLDFKSSGEREDGAEGIAGVSASRARAMAAGGNLEGFAEATGAGQYAEKLYTAVRKGMGITESTVEANPNQQISLYKPDGKTYRQQPMPSLEKDPVDDADPLDILKNEPYEIDFGKEELKRIISKNFEKLNDQQRKVLKARYWLGMTLDEISEKMKLSPERIRQIEARSLRTLRHSLGIEREKDYIESVQEGEFRSRDIEDTVIPNKKLNDLKSKYLPDWEMLDHRILQAKYVAKDHRHAEEFASYINKISEEMDHFAEVTQDVAEVTVKTSTFDVKGLTILDFKLALKIDKYADTNDIEQVRMKGNFGMHESNYGRYWCSTDKKWKNRKGPKQKRSS